MSTGPAFIDAEMLQRILPVAAAVDALDAAFSAGFGDDPLRTSIGVADGDLLVMPAAAAGGFGVKLVTIAPANPAQGLPLVQGLYVLFAPGSLTPIALIDGAALTVARTAAVSALATRYLARTDAARLVIFGAGPQARSHAFATSAVRPVEHVTVVSRTAGRAAALVADLRAAGVDATVGHPDAVGQADIICTCTTSDTPVLVGEMLSPGVHINAVGAYKPTARELDTHTMRRGRVVVEQRAAALEEAGDLCIPIADGMLSPDDIVADLPELVAGAGVRRSPGDITVFKSVGLAMEDLAVAIAAVARMG